jgi:hypothetical protein
LLFFSRPETWPTTLSLVPSREPAVPLQDLQSWVKRYKPVLCTIQPHAQNIDVKTNENHYRSLVQLLTTKNLVRSIFKSTLSFIVQCNHSPQYALAAWTLSSGMHGNGVLVFPMYRVGLVGAFFPHTGIPELPKSQLVPASSQTLPASLAIQFQQLTPEQRSQFLAQVRRQHPSLTAQQHGSSHLTTGTQMRTHIGEHYLACLCFNRL